MTMSLIGGLVVFCLINLTHGFVSAGRIFSRPTASSTELKGGYDATVGSADPSTPIQFFALPGNTCPYAQRTHIALLELGLPFDLTEVTGIPKPDWYLKINPRGKVPALRLPAAEYAVIYESAICNEFLCDYADAELRQEHALMPADPFSRAKVRLLNDHCDNVFAKTQFTYLMNKDDEREDELRAEVESALAAYEDALAESGGPYLLGQDFTLADLHVIPFLQRLVITFQHWKGYELPEEKFPNLLRWLDSCLERTSVRESSMSKEKTIEVYERFVGVDYKFGGLNQNK